MAVGFVSKSLNLCLNFVCDGVDMCDYVHIAILLGLIGFGLL